MEALPFPVGLALIIGAVVWSILSTNSQEAKRKEREEAEKRFWNDEIKTSERRRSPPLPPYSFLEDETTTDEDGRRARSKPTLDLFWKLEDELEGKVSYSPRKQSGQRTWDCDLPPTPPPRPPKPSPPPRSEPESEYICPVHGVLAAQQVKRIALRGTIGVQCDAVVVPTGNWRCGEIVGIE